MKFRPFPSVKIEVEMQKLEEVKMEFFLPFWLQQSYESSQLVSVVAPRVVVVHIDRSHWNLCPFLVFVLNYEPCQMGASTVKWTTPNPCLVFNECASKYTLTLNFVKEKKS
jgi:hypothetical protein